MSHYLVTGGAGFIGSHLVDSLVREGHQVTVLDNFDSYYDRGQKLANIAEHVSSRRVRLVEADIRDPRLPRLLPRDRFDAIVHLAALAGVRPSLERPAEYQDVNVVGTTRLLDFARQSGVTQFVFASSSSVYGNNPRFPWSESDAELTPISPYAASKLAGEMIGHVFSQLHGIRFLALRFFTVYGPRQRPDLAIRKFAEAILAGRPITLFGDGSTSRDYTFVADTISGIRAAIDYDRTSFEAINLGNSEPVSLLELVRQLEAVLGHEAKIEWRPPQPGDVEKTCADVSKARRLLGYDPQTRLADGLAIMADWLIAKEQLATSI